MHRTANIPFTSTEPLFGVELMPNSDLSSPLAQNGGGYTNSLSFTTGWSYSPNLVTSSNGQWIYVDITLQPDKNYRFEVTVSNYISGTLSLHYSFNQQFTSAGVHYVDFFSGSDTNARLHLYGGAVPGGTPLDFNGSVSKISLKEILN